MITPRRTTLLRASNLQAFQRAIATTISRLGLPEARSCAIVVPTRSAAGQLRRTLENLLLCRKPPDAACGGVLVFPDILTRHELYGTLHGRLPDAPPILSAIEREVLFGAAARDAIEAGNNPPFALRPGLIAEVLGLYDALMRQRRTLEQFERLLGELESSVTFDRGAERLVAQTHFLTATFHAYESRRDATGALDEHTLRHLLVDVPVLDPLRHLIVTVPDRADRSGLWDADFDLLARLPELARVDIVVTEAVLASGLHERLHNMLPEIAEERVMDSPGSPALVAPADREGPVYFVSRDREDELMDVVRRVKRSAREQAPGH